MKGSDGSESMPGDDQSSGVFFQKVKIHLRKWEENTVVPRRNRNPEEQKKKGVD